MARAHSYLYQGMGPTGEDLHALCKAVAYGDMSQSEFESRMRFFIERAYHEGCQEGAHHANTVSKENQIIKKRIDWIETNLMTNDPRTQRFPRSC